MAERITPVTIQAQKGSHPIVCLTAYTAPMASLLDGEVDIILVGDSIGMVLYGMESTLPVTLDMMIAHGRAVASHASESCVVVDMPFASYQESKEQAFRNAACVLQETGADAVKLEGGVVMAETIRYLVERGIPVMGHVGLMPQQVRVMGGFKQQGKGDKADAVLADAKAVADTGAFAMVIEAVPDALGKKITKAVSVPTIGIGAGVDCDGQVLVTEDMLGMHEGYVPSFVKRQAKLSNRMRDGVKSFAKEVRSRTFPET